MISNLNFEKELETLLPETFSLLNSSGLAIHEKVIYVVLHGSRGLAGGARLDSDIDLSLIVDINTLSQPSIKALLERVTAITLEQWQSHVELDLAVIFDSRSCNLKCFRRKAWDETLCIQGGEDCFGIYKINKGFSGFINNAGIQVQRMYPCLVIWHRK